MLRKERKLDEVVSNMKSLGEMLVPYNYPQSLSSLLDDDLDFFKEREIVVEGYSLIIYYQKSDYDDYFLKTLQIYNKIGPFLPFNLVLKIGIKFLGHQNLSLVEIFKGNRKIYCWSLATDNNNLPIELPFETEVENCEYEGFNYFYIKPSHVNFY